MLWGAGRAQASKRYEISNIKNSYSFSTCDPTHDMTKGDWRLHRERERERERERKREERPSGPPYLVDVFLCKHGCMAGPLCINTHLVSRSQTQDKDQTPKVLFDPYLL